MTTAGAEDLHVIPSSFYQFAANALSYAIIIVPATLVVKYYLAHQELLGGDSCFQAALRACVLGAATEQHTEAVKTKSAQREVQSGLKRYAILAFLVLGLQASYLAWGVLQEKMMTVPYGHKADGTPIYFTNSQYLVFLNRGLALIIAMLLVYFTEQPPNAAPLYKYSFPSMSNILSSWCQYEALKFVSFPTQVLAKATKTIPVMLMGRFVDGKTYPVYEYVCAVVMAVGVSLFMFSDSGDGEKADPMKTTTLTGAIMLLGYMVFDSFTSNYQSALFKTYHMSEYQMMLGVNIFSAAFCLWTLIQRGEIGECISFTAEHPEFLWHSGLLSVCSALGQIFIFHTISRYGPLVFTIVMTTRQAISVFISAVLFQHAFGTMAWLGVLVVFSSMFARTYFSAGEKGGKKAKSSSEPKPGLPA